MSATPTPASASDTSKVSGVAIKAEQPGLVDADKPPNANDIHTIIVSAFTLAFTDGSDQPADDRHSGHPARRLRRHPGPDDHCDGAADHRD